MTQEPQKDSSHQQFQVYDAGFKNWISEQAPHILPVLLPGAIYEATVDVQILRPPMRVDKAFKIVYNGEEHVLHVEFESGYDDELKSRLLVYNAILYRDHHLPVLTIVVYPFRTTMAKPPLRILSQKQPILTFLFKTLPLFKLDAADIVRQRHACLYPLVPTMKNVHADLIDQVMQELVQLYHDDEATLSQQFVLIQLLLERSSTLTRVKKEQIKRRLTVFEQLFEESPMIQNMREQYRMQGIEQGKVIELQELLVKFMRTKYPDLAEFARASASRFDKLQTLEQFALQVINAPNASTTRRLLEAGTEMEM